MINILELETRKLADEKAKLLDWELYRMPINNPTSYRGRGRPRFTDYAIYKTPEGNKIKELYGQKI